MRSKKAVVLLSGGIDSATTLFIAKKQGFKCSCLIFDYGQRHKKEILSAKRIAASAHCPYKVIKIRFPWKGSALLDTDITVPKQREKGIPATYVPARNIVFLSFAASFAEAIGAKALFIGAHSQDYSGYPDCRPEFFRAFSKVISCGTKSGVEKRNINIQTPLIRNDKAGIIKIGSALGVPFELTWSCYQGGKSPCGECDSCYYREKGFRQAAIIDPLIKYER